MADLIERARLMHCIEKWLPRDKCGDEAPEDRIIADLCVSMLMEIEEQPTVDAGHVVHAHWIATAAHTWDCSNCGGNEFQQKTYCPIAARRWTERTVKTMRLIDADKLPPYLQIWRQLKMRPRWTPCRLCGARIARMLQNTHGVTGQYFAQETRKNRTIIAAEGCEMAVKTRRTSTMKFDKIIYIMVQAIIVGSMAVGLGTLVSWMIRTVI